MQQYLTYCKIVREGAPGGDPALSNTNNTIHMRCAIHVQAMEMQARRLISQRVLNIDNDLVAFRGYNSWKWPFSIDAHDRACVLAIRICVQPSYVEVVGDSCTLSDCCKNRQRNEKVR